MDTKEKVLRNLSYGLYQIGVMDGQRPCGCIINTVFQVTSDNPSVAISMLNDNYTWELIEKENRFSVSILSEKTRKEIIIVMPDRTAKSTVLALNRLERRFGAKFRKIFKSITVDNGTEFSDLEGMKKSILYSGLRTKFYYCHPYSSWERGSNENLNRMIRRKFPKGTSFADVTRKQVQNVEDWMNNYPRKVLGYLTAEMAYQTCVAAL